MTIYDFESEDTNLIKSKVDAFLPNYVTIPLTFKNEGEILVKEGDIVKEGDSLSKIGDTFVHSSLPGTVIQIDDFEFADGSFEKGAKIKFSGSFNFTGKQKIECDWKNYDKNMLLYLFSENGVFNTFGKVESISSQIKNLNPKSNKIVFARLFSEDPSRLSDGFLVKNYFEQVVTGVFIIAKALDASGIVFAFDKEFEISKDFFEKQSEIPFETIFVDSKAYPSGFKHDLVHQYKKQIKNPLFKNCGIYDFFVDCQTCLNVYNAVVLNQSVINQIVHFSGNCLKNASFLNVKIGITLKDVINQCGGLKKLPSKIIINGNVTGLNISSIDLPLTQNVKSVFVISKEEIPDQEEQNCIRCGKCHDICPISLYPESLLKISLNENLSEHEKLIKQSAVLCSECALCNSVCPARINLCEHIQKIKKL